jgi:hypothetical protein
MPTSRASPRPAFPTVRRLGRDRCRIAVAEHTVFIGDHDLDRAKRTWASSLWLRCTWGWWLPPAREPRRSEARTPVSPGFTSSCIPLPVAHLGGTASGLRHPDRQHGEAAGRNLHPVARPVGE